MKVNIKTKDFLLRNYRPGDEPDLVKNINDRIIARFTSKIPYPYTKKDAHSFIQRALKKDKTKPTTGINIAIVMGKEVVGGIGSSFKGHIASIGYWVAKRCRGTGLSRQAVNEIIKFLFKQKKIIRIEAKTFLKNKKSQQLLLDLGFRREGLLRKNVEKNGKYIDCYIFSKLK